jgi:hypothetical protein
VKSLESALVYVVDDKGQLEELGQENDANVKKSMAKMLISAMEQDYLHDLSLLASSTGLAIADDNAEKVEKEKTVE